MSSPAQPRIISIRWIVSAGAVALMTIAVLGVSIVGERNAQGVLTRELQTRLIVEARNLALTSSRALLSDFPELTLAPIIAEMSGDESGGGQTAVVDQDGNIRGHANARLIGEPYDLPTNAVPLETAAGLHDGERVLLSDALLVAAAPVRHPQGHPIGTAYVSFPRDYVSSVLAEVRRKQLILAGGMLLVAVLLGPLLMASLLRPVQALRDGLERIGRGDLDTPVRLKDRTELGLLARTMNRMSEGLREAQKQKAEKERLTHELELARQIQSSLLPPKELQAGPFVLSGAHRAAAEVGGDLWDVFPLGDGRFGLAIADVSGKGLAGCLVTSMLSALLRAFRSEENSPAALLARLEDHLPLRSGMFITMFYGILDPTDGSLVFASAAHSPVLVRRAGGKSEWYRTKGIPIGAVKGGMLATTLQDDRIVLHPGDVLVQYTDGINEAFDESGVNQFDFERIESAVARESKGGGDAVIGAILDDLKKWAGDAPPLDDETLLVVSCNASAPASRPAQKAAAPAPAEKAAAPAPGQPASAAGRPVEGARAKGKTVADPLRALDRARRHGYHLALSSDLEKLKTIRPWVEACPGFLSLDPEDLALIESALYETCANVVEHGYGMSPGQIDVWWAPRDDLPGRLAGEFVIVDAGPHYRPDERAQLDFHDSAVRRRGRGLGLEIIRAAMQDVSYHPGTPAGNITILAFDESASRKKEVPNV